MNVLRLGQVFGNGSLQNEVICSSLENFKIFPKSLTLFFGGDVQNYPEEMTAHRDHGKHLKWNLINTVSLLSLKFPSDFICVIKPKRTEIKTFSCFDNFVESNDVGVPSFSQMHGSLSHLRKLIFNTFNQLSSNCNENIADDAKISENFSNFDKISLIGFSKGCVVLNQIVNEVHTIYSRNCEENYEDIKSFWEKVKSIYWLDGGHSGGKNTWITDRSILLTLASFQNLSINVHVTPYQVRDPMRPWIGKECKTFVSTLRKFGVDVQYRLHFEDDDPSIENHFRVLEHFKEDSS